jgi:hypothetical protein
MVDDYSVGDVVTLKEGVVEKLQRPEPSLLIRFPSGDVNWHRVGDVVSVKRVPPAAVGDKVMTTSSGPGTLLAVHDGIGWVMLTSGPLKSRTPINFQLSLLVRMP